MDGLDAVATRVSDCAWPGAHAPDAQVWPAVPPNGEVVRHAVTTFRHSAVATTKASPSENRGLMNVS